MYWERESVSDADLKLMRRMGITALYGSPIRADGRLGTRSGRTCCARCRSRARITPGRWTSPSRWRAALCTLATLIDRNSRRVPAWRLSISMDGKGCWRDNVLIEEMWRSIEHEEVYLHADQTLRNARDGIDCHIDFHNTRRSHSTHRARIQDAVYFASLPQPSAEAV